MSVVQTLSKFSTQQQTTPAAFLVGQETNVSLPSTEMTWTFHSDWRGLKFWGCGENKQTHFYGLISCF